MVENYGFARLTPSPKIMCLTGREGGHWTCGEGANGESPAGEGVLVGLWVMVAGAMAGIKATKEKKV